MAVPGTAIVPEPRGWRLLIVQLMRTCATGVANAASQYATLIGLVVGLGAPPVPAALFSYLVGGTLSYLLNYYWVFGSAKDHRVAAAQFLVVAGVGFVLTGVFMAALTGPLELHWLLSQVVTTGLVVVWSLGANRFWIFRTSGSAHSAQREGRRIGG